MVWVVVLLDFVRLLKFKQNTVIVNSNTICDLIAPFNHYWEGGGGGDKAKNRKHYDGV